MALVEPYPGALSPAFIADHEKFYAPRDGRAVILACGDDGAPTAASQLEVVESFPEDLMVSPSEGMISIFGQTAGLTLVAMAVGIAVHGPKFFEAVGGIDGLHRQVIDYMRKDNSRHAVRPASHSDSPKEMAASKQGMNYLQQKGLTFIRSGDDPIGCAYATHIGAIPHAITNDRLVRDVATEDIARIAGDEREVEPLIKAHAVLANLIEPTFAYDRQYIIENGLPALVVKRYDTSHIPADVSGVVFNNDPNSIGRAHDHYRVDAASGALILRRMLPEYELPTKLLMTGFILDAVPVRALLASHDASGDHTPDPRRLAIGIRGGSIAEAVDAITAIETETA